MRLTVPVTIVVALCGVAGCEDRIPDYRRDAGRIFDPDAARRDAGEEPEVDSGPRPDAGPFRHGVEVRCEELGDACVCSEPLDTNGWGVIDGEYADPVDSPSDTECAGQRGEGSVWYPRDTILTELASGMPATSRVLRVWTNTIANGESRLFGSRGIGEEATRTCARVYVRFGAGYEGAGVRGCLANPQMEIAFASDDEHPRSRLRLYEEGGAFHLEGLDFGGVARTEIPGGGEALAHGDCSAEWCRMELCVAGNLHEGTGLTADASVHTMGGRVMTFGAAAVPDATLGRVRRVLIADMSREGDCSGTRSYSHAMQAAWNEDTGQHIGPAAEIEGS